MTARAALAALLLFALPSVGASQVAPRALGDTALSRTWIAYHEFGQQALALLDGREGTFEGDVARDLMITAHEMYTRVEVAVDFASIMAVIADSASRERAGRQVRIRLQELAAWSELEILGIDRAFAVTKVPGTAVLADRLKAEVRVTARLLRSMALRY